MPNLVQSSTPLSEKDEWRTLPSLYERLNREFNFGYDFAATKDNAFTTLAFTKEISALDSMSWFFVVDNSVNPAGFLNPPFSLVGEFLAKANEQIVLAGERFLNPIIVCLVRADCPETLWWRNNVLDRDGYVQHEIRYLYPRLPYCNPRGEIKKNINFPSALIIMRRKPWNYVRWFNWKDYVNG